VHEPPDWRRQAVAPGTWEELMDIGVELTDLVATVELRRPPHNFFDIDLIREIADACEALDRDPACRAIVLAAQGTAFCAGAKLGDGADVQDVLVRTSSTGQTANLYSEAVRLYRTAKPMVGAIHGAAVGGGLGLALVPDVRVTCPEARFCANFTRLGFHPGFGLTHTLPALIGPSKAALMLYTSRRIGGEEACRIGLADVLVPQAEVRAAAQRLAAEIAENAPLGVLETRATLRAGLAEAVRAATDIELAKQTRLRLTDDFTEGVDAVNQRRKPRFTGR
jgi:enoyl-CoA hydratase/carnithine racemase